MKGVLLGAWHSKGTTELKDNNGNITGEMPYDNLVLCFTKPIEPVTMEKHVKDWTIGNTTVEAKCPWNNRLDPFAGKISDVNELADYFGMELTYSFNDKKKLDMVLL